jgi:hypothetical protein
MDFPWIDFPRILTELQNVSVVIAGTLLGVRKQSRHRHTKKGASQTKQMGTHTCKSLECFTRLKHNWFVERELVGVAIHSFQCQNHHRIVHQEATDGAIVLGKLISIMRRLIFLWRFKKLHPVFWGHKRRIWDELEVLKTQHMSLVGSLTFSVINNFDTRLFDSYDLSAYFPDHPKPQANFKKQILIVFGMGGGGVEERKKGAHEITCCFQLMLPTQPYDAKHAMASLDGILALNEIKQTDELNFVGPLAKRRAK